MTSTRHGRATNTPEPEILIRPAQESDISSMLKIAQQRALQGSQENASKNGFLVSNFSRDDYCELLQRAEYFYVAAIHSEVVGFVIAYSRDRIGEDEWLNMQMIDNFHNFTVIKQVGVSKAHSGKSIATRLYARILERAGSGTVVAAVVSDPPNRPSEALHRKMGFQPVTTLTPPDGIPRTVWVRQPVDTKLLESQLSMALDLYKHEDILNWQKLNNFFYISAWPPRSVRVFPQSGHPTPENHSRQRQHCGHHHITSFLYHAARGCLIPSVPQDCGRIS